MISSIFSLSDEDRDNADSLVIKPPQVVVRVSHRDKRSHKRSGKDRFKETSRKDKKLLYNRCVFNAHGCVIYFLMHCDVEKTH